MGTNTPLPSKKEPCASYIMGACMKKYGCVYTHDVRRGIYIETPIKEAWVCMQPRSTARNIDKVKFLFKNHGCVCTNDVHCTFLGDLWQRLTS